jgi:hypothetical protein
MLNIIKLEQDKILSWLVLSPIVHPDCKFLSIVSLKAAEEKLIHFKYKYTRGAFAKYTE